MKQTGNHSEQPASKVAADTTTSSDEISLIDLILILWRGKYIIIACTILATFSGVIHALRAPEVFTSTSHFITKTGRSGGAGNLGQLAAMAGVSMDRGGRVDPSEYLDRVIQDQHFLTTFYERKWFFGGDSLPLEEILEIEKDTTVGNWQHRYHMAKLDRIRRGNIIDLSKDVRTGILTLRSNAPDPQLAYDLNTYTLDWISDYIRNSLQTQAREKRSFIEERLSEVRADLQRSENALARFKERNIMSTSPKVVVEEGRLTRQVTLNQEMYLQLQKQYEMARIEELDDQTLVQVVRSAEVPVRRSRPKRTQMVIISSLVGVLLGLLMAFVHNCLLKVIRTLRLG
ncbi:lipopolysaccharide biosynthesis protein [Chitinispirillum alkaliphilum]|nr:lipopolysaccharide biosynthesis protein [Chitinispirillum alkaliphilum]